MTKHSGLNGVLTGGAIACLLVVACLSTGCSEGSEGDTTSRGDVNTVDTTESLDRQLEGPIGVALAADTPVGTWTPDDGVQIGDKALADQLNEEYPDESYLKLGYVDYQSGIVYFQALSREVLHEQAKGYFERGENAANHGDIEDAQSVFERVREATNDDGSEGPAREVVIQKAWTGGVDNRSNLGISSSYPWNNWPYRTIGTVNRNCTGTLFGSRLVATAGHCVVGSNPGNLTGSVFRPRDNDVAASSSNGGISDATPWGEPSSVGGYYLWHYVNTFQCNDSNGFAPNVDACIAHDWAALILGTNWWPAATGHPGYMGVWYASSGTMDDWYFYDRGYPLCSHSSCCSGSSCLCPERPSGCSYPRLWGTGTGDIGDFTYVAGGWEQIFNASTDNGRGHSGTGLYSYNPGSSGPYIMGIFSWQNCFTCSSGTVRPNRYKRIDQWLGDFMMSLRTSFP